MTAWVEALVHDAHLDWQDTTGRWLGEQASPHYATAAADQARCPYPDARLGGEMNAAAYKQVAAHWDTILEDLATHSGPTAAHAWRATCRLRWAPLWEGDPVSARSAATFKTALGLNRPLTSWLLLSPGSASRPLHTLCPPDQLLTRLDTEGWLHGQRQVCAAPPARLVEAWTALHDDRLPPPHRGDKAAVLTAGLWAILGATRALLREGVLDEVPGWSPVAPPHPDWPVVTHLLAARGPGALVREVPHFQSEWSLHVYSHPPPALMRLVVGCQRARHLRELDALWTTFVTEAVSPLERPALQIPSTTS